MTRLPWKKKSNLYTGFVLRKENMETLEAIDRLSKCVGANPSDFSYAGTKDKKAITLQNMVVKGVSPIRLNKANSDPALPNIKIGSYKTVEKPLKMGQLRGNAFRIVIRDVQEKGVLKRPNKSVDAMHSDVTEIMLNTAGHGFVNYFGHQRFGHEEGVAARADAVGLAMLQGNVLKAVNTLLMPDSDKNDEANAAKRYYQETGDIPGTISRMPHSKIRERLMLKALHRHGKDQDGCTKALFSIPYPMRLLYTHSYTSLVWNKMASLRLREYSASEIVDGDLVYDYDVTSNSAEHARRLNLDSSTELGNVCGINASSHSLGSPNAQRKNEFKLSGYAIQEQSLQKKPLQKEPLQQDQNSSSVGSVSLSDAQCTEHIKLPKGTFNSDPLTQEPRLAHSSDITIESDGNNDNDVLSTLSVDKSRVRVVTHEDIRAKKFTIRDLVLPIPGYNALYPTNSIGERYRETLASDGLTEKHFRLRSLGLSMPGAYRRVIAKPRDLRYKWISEDSVTVNKTLSAAGSGSSLPEDSSGNCNAKPQTSSEMKLVFQNDETRHNIAGSESSVGGETMEESRQSQMVAQPLKKRARLDNKAADRSEILTDLEISFKLDSSCYATVCLREMMKS